MPTSPVRPAARYGTPSAAIRRPAPAIGSDWRGRGACEPPGKQRDFLPPHYAWEWANDPVKRNLWMPAGNVWSRGDRPHGRVSTGASNHCAHGKGIATEIVLDWRPFEYATSELYDNDKKMGRQMFRFEPLPNGGTRIIRLMEFDMKIPRPLRKMVGKAMT